MRRKAAYEGRDQIDAESTGWKTLYVPIPTSALALI
jgi:hypothetical protein